MLAAWPAGRSRAAQAAAGKPLALPATLPLVSRTSLSTEYPPAPNTRCRFATTQALALPEAAIPAGTEVAGSVVAVRKPAYAGLPGTITIRLDPLAAASGERIHFEDLVVSGPGQRSDRGFVLLIGSSFGALLGNPFELGAHARLAQDEAVLASLRRK